MVFSFQDFSSALWRPGVLLWEEGGSLHPALPHSLQRHPLSCPRAAVHASAVPTAPGREAGGGPDPNLPFSLCAPPPRRRGGGDAAGGLPLSPGSPAGGLRAEEGVAAPPPPAAEGSRRHSVPPAQVVEEGGEPRWAEPARLVERGPGKAHPPTWPLGGQGAGASASRRGGGPKR